jgi:hypothetical protein
MGDAIMRTASKSGGGGPFQTGQSGRLNSGCNLDRIPADGKSSTVKSFQQCETKKAFPNVLWCVWRTRSPDSLETHSNPTIKRISLWLDLFNLTNAAVSLLDSKLIVLEGLQQNPSTTPLFASAIVCSIREKSLTS